MPFVKIHMSSAIQPEVCKSLVSDIRTTLVEVLQIEESIGQVMLYQTPIQHRSTLESRNVNFVFSEIIMYPGRKIEMKKELMEKINNLIQDYTGVQTRDINCCIIEVPPENWSGGISHKYITDVSGKVSPIPNSNGGLHSSSLEEIRGLTDGAKEIV